MTKFIKKFHLFSLFAKIFVNSEYIHNELDNSIHEFVQNSEFTSRIPEESSREYLDLFQGDCFQKVEQFCHENFISGDIDCNLIDKEFSIQCDVSPGNQELHDFLKNEDKIINQIEIGNLYNSDSLTEFTEVHNDNFNIENHGHSDPEIAFLERQDHEKDLYYDASFDGLVKDVDFQEGISSNLNEHNHDLNEIRTFSNVENEFKSTQVEHIEHEFFFNNEKITISASKDLELEFKYQDGKLIIQNGNEKYDVDAKRLSTSSGDEIITSNPWDIDIQIEKTELNKENGLSGGQIAGLVTGIGVSALVGVGGVLGRKLGSRENYNIFGTAQRAFSEQLSNKGFFNCSKEILRGARISGSDDILDAVSVVDDISGKKLKGNPGLNRLIQRRRCEAFKLI